MPLYRLLQNQGFEPLHIEVMTYAFEAVCVQLELPDQSDSPEREWVAKAVIEAAQRGVLNPEQLRDHVLGLVSSAVRPLA